MESLHDLQNLESEIWKDIEGFEGLYQISNLGKIKSLKRIIVCKNDAIKYLNERILASSPHRNGYHFIYLSKNGKTHYRSVSRLVAMHFIPNPENKPQVNHINAIRNDNRSINLEWVNQSENNKHSYKMGRVSAKGMSGKSGAKNVNSKAIYQFTIDGEFVAKYESGHQAAKITGFGQGNIAAVARGLYKVRHGYRWSYTDKPNLL